jgi:two-component system, OmpR family, KDP operon response regulator KdpE
VVHDGQDELGAARSALGGVGFEVGTVELQSCLDRVIGQRPDLVLVDLGDNEGQGLRLCGQVRSQSYVPLVLVGSDDRWLVPALSAGADDYLSKPIDLSVMLAKILALLRRCGYTAESQRVIEIRDLAIDMDRCQVLLGGHPLSLTPIEYRILAALARRAGRVLSCAELIREAQGYETDEQEARDIIKVHIYHLRRKMEAFEDGAEYVVTVPGFGYMLERRITARPNMPATGWTRRGVIRTPERAVERAI